MISKMKKNKRYNNVGRGGIAVLALVAVLTLISVITSVFPVGAAVGGSLYYVEYTKEVDVADGKMTASLYVKNEGYEYFSFELRTVIGCKAVDVELCGEYNAVSVEGDNGIKKILFACPDTSDGKYEHVADITLRFEEKVTDGKVYVMIIGEGLDANMQSMSTLCTRMDILLTPAESVQASDTDVSSNAAGNPNVGAVLSERGGADKESSPWLIPVYVAVSVVLTAGILLWVLSDRSKRSRSSES